MSRKTRIYPQWFIDELVNEEDKEKAINGNLLNKEKVLFTCPEGHVYMQCVNAHIHSTNGDRKCGCPICGKMKREKNRLETLKNKRIYPQWFIDEIVNEEDKVNAINGKLNSKNIVTFRCENGHEYKQTVGVHINLSTGERKHGCPICNSKLKSEKAKKQHKNKRVYPQWFIDELVNEEDKEKAKSSILTSKDIVTFKCENGHEYRQLVGVHISLSTGEKKYGCPCEKNERIQSSLKEYFLKTKKVVYPQWFVDEIVNEEDKVNAIKGFLPGKKKYLFKCINGHEYSMTISNRIKLSTGEEKHGCPHCNNSRSKVELEIEEYVKSLGYNTEHKRFRDSDNRIFEIDIFIPEKNVGIEYNGSYYHSLNDNRINKKYHYDKFNECRKQDILLITIFDIEWDNRKEEIKQYINDIIEGKENELSYNRKGYMNNNYPSWKHYKDNNNKYFEDSYLYREKYRVYTCGYSIIRLNTVVN